MPIVVRNNSRMLWPTIDMIRQLELESSIGKVLVSCKF